MEWGPSDMGPLPPDMGTGIPTPPLVTTHCRSVQMCLLGYLPPPLEGTWYQRYLPLPPVSRQMRKHYLPATLLVGGNYFQIRKHSSRLCTACFPSCGGSAQLPWMQNPPPGGRPPCWMLVMWHACWEAKPPHPVNRQV